MLPVALPADVRAICRGDPGGSGRFRDAGAFAIPPPARYWRGAGPSGRAAALAPRGFARSRRLPVPARRGRQSRATPRARQLGRVWVGSRRDGRDRQLDVGREKRRPDRLPRPPLPQTLSRRTCATFLAKSANPNNGRPPEQRQRGRSVSGYFTPVSIRSDRIQANQRPKVWHGFCLKA